MQGDDFSASSLNTNLWTFEDPRANCSVSQSAGVLNLVVGTANSHDFYTDGINICRITQPATDRRFIVTMKLNAIQTVNYQLGGMAFFVSDTKALRFDRYYSTGQQFYCSTIDTVAVTDNTHGSGAIGTGTVPYWLRTTRSDNSWLCEYSSDGTTWTTAASFTDASLSGMTKWGVYAGNSDPGSGSPAYTELIDWVTVTSYPKIVNLNQTIQRATNW
jgi:hypothetical protein